jgi:NADPH-dependent 2,4-dienoyl-CoA reductase/sulfur reductase-like enzyme/nitrite reductase/ring-hydroxylating ferredoxin subunit
MGGGARTPAGPDFQAGIPLERVPDGGTLPGRVGDEAVLLARRGDDVFAIGATCTHYGGPLAEGILAGDTIRCPWHHAAFDLATGAAIRHPARDAIPCFGVERRGGTVFVTGRAPAPSPPPARGPHPARIVVVGGGAAGNAAVETLRAEGYAGSLTLVSADPDPPYDRPNLSKDYLAGSAPEEWIPLRDRRFYDEKKVELRLGLKAAGIERAGRSLRLADGTALPYDALLLATGADPIRLPIPGAELPHVRTLRTLADSRALVAAAGRAERAVVLGASFIGLEAAASLRTRGLAVDVVAPESVPLERVMGPVVGAFVKALHEEHGVVFHLGRRPREIGPATVTLDDGRPLPSDLVVMGVGVRPVTSLAEGAGLATDRGILVDEHLRTSDPLVFAAGDAARYPDPRTGGMIRIEHWVVAQRQGRTAARNMLGGRERFDAVPFFWSAHYDVTISYVGHAEGWDAVEIEGLLGRRDAKVVYGKEGRTLAVATVGRDRESLLAELAMEGGPANP